MSDPDRLISEDELQAFVDNRLDQGRQSAVQRHLLEHPEIGRRIAAYTGQRDALREALAPLAAEPVPPQLHLQALVERRLGRRRMSWAVAASVAFAFALGGAGGWFARGGFMQPPGTMMLLTEQAVANYIVYTADRRRPTELGADQRDDLARWVSNRLNHKVAPPDLSADGYHYMGGRLAATPNGPAGMFMYDDNAACSRYAGN